MRSGYRLSLRLSRRTAMLNLDQAELACLYSKYEACNRLIFLQAKMVSSPPPARALCNSPPSLYI